MTTNIRTLDMRLIDDLFDMGSGYVLDFSDRTFAAFFAEALDIEINDRKYFAEGSSKAKRLRYFLKVSDPQTRKSEFSVRFGNIVRPCIAGKVRENQECRNGVYAPSSACGCFNLLLGAELIVCFPSEQPESGSLQVASHGAPSDLRPRSSTARLWVRAIPETPLRCQRAFWSRFVSPDWRTDRR